MNTHTDSDVCDFLYHESDLLDRGAWREWLDLFDDAAVYWVPSQRGQADALQQLSLIHEDKALLRMRIGRLEHPAAHGLARPVRTSRLLGNVRVRRLEGGRLRTQAKFTMLEWQDGRVRLFGGDLTHLLVDDGGLRILEKRVDLFNVEEAFESIQLLF